MEITIPGYKEISKSEVEDYFMKEFDDTYIISTL